MNPSSGPASAECDPRDRALLRALADGLPLSARPYAEVGAGLGMSECEVRTRLQRLLASGIVKRFGLVVHHRALGYRANAMVVWDVPDADVDATATVLAGSPGVTLCYRRPRRGPDWPYNLFCMIHGRDRAAVLARIAAIASHAALAHAPRAVLFSRRCFKQRGATYPAPAAQAVP
jgi:DNA-binding Lrp family transcriptional regulator